MKSKTKLPLGYKIIGIALVLLALVMFSTWLMSGLYARYVTRGAPSDGARVAMLGEVTVTGHDYTIYPGLVKILVNDKELYYSGSEMASYVFLVVNTTNGSWSFDYSNKVIGLSVPEHIDAVLEWVIDSDWEYLTEDGTGRYVFYLRLPPNATLSKSLVQTLTVSMFVSRTELENYYNAGYLDVTFEGYLMQYGHFPGASTEYANALAAYNSLMSH